MGQIAELFVRLRGDVSDWTRKAGDADRALSRIENGTKRLDGQLKITGLNTGRLGNQFANLAGHIAGVHPIVGNLAGVLSTFAVGTLTSAGILGGLAALAVAYDKITESGRKAREQTDKFIQGLVAEARALREASVAGAEFNKLRADIELQEAKAASGVGLRTLLLRGLPGTPAGAMAGADQEALAKRIADAQTGVEQAQIRVNKAYENANKPIKEISSSVKEVTGRYNELRNAAASVNAEILREKTDWWKGYIERTNEAITLTEELRRSMNAALMTPVEALRSMVTVPTPEFSMPKISMPFEDLNDKQKKQLVELGILKDDANKNAERLSSAIWGSAQMLGDTLVSALNVGGGGRGSQIGQSLLGGIGTVLGNMTPLGPIGGVLGGIAGGLAGSVLGGLFDHNTKAVNSNTEALRQNTAALILNAPAGFKSERYRYDATELRALDRAVRKRMTRGGAPILGTP